VTEHQPVVVAVALGSNLGDRAAFLRGAADELSALLDNFRISSFHDTTPVGVAPQPRYLNAAAVGTSVRDPRSLLDALLAIEARHGRTRLTPGAPRTLDLDLILYGDRVISEAGLEVPHPRFRERAFVLAPLAEIAPELRDPVTGQTVRDLLEGIRI
jgi:2-amino-4-hydroxy-6-hydroxymethyldihydropteridine diphosphokinase